jgi:flagellar basal body-associated protein FliL
MSEEIQNDGSMDSLKKTIIGAIGTLVTAAGVWASTHLFGGETEHKEEAKTETAAPVAPIVVNIENTNQQKQSAAPTTIIREKVVEKPAKKEKSEDESPW